MRAALVPLALTALCLSGCGEPSAPGINLRIIAATTGADEDRDGYLTTVGSRSATVIAANGVREYALEPGTHQVRIEGVASNCTLQSPSTKTITIQQGALAEVTFDIECRAITGVIELRGRTTGRDYPPAGYWLSVTDEGGDPWLTAVPANGPTYLSPLVPGSYELQFLPAGNCTLSGPATRTVAVTAGSLVRDTARVEFAVSCAATTGDVELTLTTTGAAPDPDGYTVRVDGVLVEVPDENTTGYVPLRLLPNGGHLLERIGPGDRGIELGDLAGNCAVTGPNPRTVSVTIGGVAPLAIGVVCGP